MESIKEFTQNTTLHGIRYVGGSHSTFRRLMWLIFVLACLTGVIFQIVDRVGYFYDRPIAVNVKINYNQTLDFPAVTICNQNAFRATKAAESHRYRLIEYIFSTTGKISMEKLEKFNSTDLSLEELYTSLAHTKEDFIVNCVWKNGECSRNDFEMILTDHGVCYIFKKEKRDMLVASSGVDSGLRVTLNVEQYEYMTGPHDSAGIKILLHDAREMPFVHELGQAVPTGTHAFVGVKFMTIDNLPKPYGECDTKQLGHTDYYTTEECYLDCLVNLARERCGCRDIYMPDSTGSTPVCTLGKYYSCLVDLKAEFSTSLREDCGCPVPCYFALYDPSVSYASISNHLVSKLLTSSEASLLVDKLENASEITSKMDRDTFEYFKSIADTFYNKFTQLTEVIASISNCLSSQRNVTEEIVSEMTDVYNVKERIYRYQDYSIEKNFLRGREAMEERTLNNVANAYAEFAMLNKRRIIRLATENNTDDTGRFELYKLVTDDLIVRQEIAEKARANITLLLNAYITGTPIFNYKFEDLPRAHNPFIVPKPLMNYSMNHNHYMIKYVPKLNSSDFDLMYSVLDMFIEQASIAYENRTVNESTLNYVYERFQFACRTYMFSKSVVYTQGIELPSRVIQERLSNFKNEWSSFNSDIVDLRQNMNSLTTLLKNVTTNILPDLERIIFQMRNYTENSEGHLMQLANVFLSNETKLLTNILKNFFQEVQTRGQQIHDSANLLHKPIENIWTTIITDEDSIEYYNYTDNVLFLRNLSVVLREWADNVNELKDLDVRRHVFNKDEDYFVANDAVTVHLEEFKDAIVVDGMFLKQNFLQLDIFYRQLSYEYISQHKAYDFFALICDIGGAMGLFIGASMLTIVEIIDLFLIQLPIFKRKEEKQKNGVALT
ncbi:uncharacterized protein LOC123544907 isoform X3 [Mercenaria mercenaria]|uniref:uncharacterized protein LOC123544907 isoform X2 n=1 Tax=Mercenaria mercenaria TaxID=6596 RepID=UPI00234EBA88|nr:uncharacterized protein LOC123544907 isoform X2 [Mercenaria mercenaria]XP_053396444.1 uncharacterized protein LOC123544907 isoform X3 [Mercenaria mercenaria]